MYCIHTALPTPRLLCYVYYLGAEVRAGEPGGCAADPAQGRVGGQSEAAADGRLEPGPRAGAAARHALQGHRQLGLRQAEPRRHAPADQPLRGVSAQPEVEYKVDIDIDVDVE